MYVVRKPFNAGGKRWMIGEIVPEKVVQSPSLERAGFVARIDSGLLDIAEGAVSVPEAAEGEVQVNVPIITKDGSMDLSVAPAVIYDALRLIQSAGEDVIKEVKDIQSEDLLIILDACDGRKNVRSAVRKQADALKADGEGDD